MFAEGELVRAALPSVASVALAATGLTAVVDVWRRREWHRKTRRLALILLGDAAAETLRLAQLAYAVPLSLLDPGERALAMPLTAAFQQAIGAEKNLYGAFVEATTAVAYAAANEELAQAKTVLSKWNESTSNVWIAALPGARAAASADKNVEFPLASAVVDAWRALAPRLDDQGRVLMQAVNEAVSYLNSDETTNVLDVTTLLRKTLRESIFEDVVDGLSGRLSTLRQVRNSSARQAFAALFQRAARSFGGRAAITARALNSWTQRLPRTSALSRTELTVSQAPIVGQAALDRAREAALTLGEIKRLIHAIL